MSLSRITIVVFVAGTVVTGLLMQKLRRANRRLKLAQKEVALLKDQLHRAIKASHSIELLGLCPVTPPAQPPSTIAMNLVDPKLYAALRRQCPELPAVHKPSRAESLWSHFDATYKSSADHERGLAELLASIQTLFCELNSDDFKWENDHDHKPDAASMQLFWHRVHMSISAKTPQEARQSPLPDIRSGQLFCKVLEFEILSRRSKLLPDVAAQRGASPRGSIARAAAPATAGGTVVWIAAALQTSSVQLLKYSHSSTSPRRPLHEMHERVTVLSIINDHMLRHHTTAAIDLYCAGGYVLARTLLRLVEQPSCDVLPEFLYKGLCVSADSLNTVKTDEYWRKCLQHHFQSPVFFLASSSLSCAAQTPGSNVLLIVETTASRSSQNKFFPARKVANRSILDSDDEYMFAPWSMCVFRLKCKALRSSSGFRCYPQGSSLPSIAVASGISLVLLVETIPYIDSKHSSICALEFL